MLLPLLVMDDEGNQTKNGGTKRLSKQKRKKLTAKCGYSEYPIYDLDKVKLCTTFGHLLEVCEHNQSGVRLGRF